MFTIKRMLKCNIDLIHMKFLNDIIDSDEWGNEL